MKLVVLYSNRLIKLKFRSSHVLSLRVPEAVEIPFCVFSSAMVWLEKIFFLESAEELYIFILRRKSLNKLQRTVVWHTPAQAPERYITRKINLGKNPNKAKTTPHKRDDLGS
jgi:hypothetical protein